LGGVALRFHLANYGRYMEAESVVCNICGSDRFAVVFPAGKAQKNRIVRCNECGLMYATPRLGALDHAVVSKSDPNFLIEMLDRKHDSRMTKERLQVNDYKDTKQWLREHFPRRGQLVEVGCGLGFLLRSFVSDGWIGKGIDPDPLCCAHARKVLGLDAMPGTLSTVVLAPDSVDCVLMMHVLEHVPDPLGTLTQIFEALRPGGVLVLETPRYDTPSFRLLGHRERSIRHDGHAYFFTTATLEACVSLAGFSVLRRNYVGRSLTLDRMLWNISVMIQAARFAKWVTTASERLNFDKIRLRVNIQDMERLYLAKPSQ
jgi:2-polyprenyl-3-methyl-5-hydroxy-6-metoxy-1,4-benzoquinol methylase